MEPLLRWLVIGSRGYTPTRQLEQPASAYMTYDDHGYADDISITTGTLPREPPNTNTKATLIFSKYTGLELETTKCEATGALGGYGNPLSKANTRLLRCQINIKKFEDGTPIRYLPPSRSKKMLGEQIIPMLYFRDHLNQVTTDVRKLAKIQTKTLISPNRKKTRSTNCSSLSTTLSI